MPSDVDHLRHLPPEQQRLRDKCYHPTGSFIPFPKAAIERSISERFEEMVRLYPDRVAVTDRLRELTYDGLNRAANQVAHAILRKLGDAPEPVAMLLGQGVSGIVAIMGILKAGKFYVPLNPLSPFAMHVDIVRHTQTRLIVTHNVYVSMTQELTQKLAVDLLNLDSLEAGLAPHNPTLCSSPSTYAYIIYTSGSTGQPKGVIENHRNVLHFTMTYTNVYHLCNEDRLSLVASFSFSGSVADIFCALLNGARLCVFDVKNCSAGELARGFIEEGITVCDMVPTLFRQIAEALTGAETFPDLRLIRLGGDRMSKTHVDLFKRHFPSHCLLRNGLGSTEVKLIRYYFMDHNSTVPHGIIPVGYPVEDIDVMILNDERHAVAFNQVGEIAIQSRYISPGYWQAPELTASRFIPAPEGSDRRTFLSGDLGLMRPDGCLIHLGRQDAQIKIRGYRIEAAEIEMALLALEDIKEAVVVAHGEASGEQRLVAYVLPAQWPGPTVSRLRHVLTEKLPEYMVPSSFVFLPSFPLNVNGKVDRHALPAPSRSRPSMDVHFCAPRTFIEAKLARIWGEVLELDEVGIHDSFLDLGGHSLLATQILTRVMQAFQVELPLQVLMEALTIAEMALVMTQHQAMQADPDTITRLLAEVETMTDDEVKHRPCTDQS